MANLKKWKGGTYRDKYGQIYRVEKINGNYRIKNQEGRVIKVDDLESFMKDVERINGLEDSIEKF
ncbi:MAG: hypothetical protein KGH55_00275 [Nanoarchaeota archaeon]|nr:hypothetical protein [Nanoarchaeota archaeon]